MDAAAGGTWNGSSSSNLCTTWCSTSFMRMRSHRKFSSSSASSGRGRLANLFWKKTGERTVRGCFGTPPGKETTSRVTDKAEEIKLQTGFNDFHWGFIRELEIDNRFICLIREKRSNSYEKSNLSLQQINWKSALNSKWMMSIYLTWCALLWVGEFACGAQPRSSEQ